jgi:hypothetical protein
MTPTAILQKLLSTNKPVATFLLGGLAVLAAATIAVSWIGQNPDALLIAAYVLGFAFLVTMATWIVRNDSTRAVIGWVLTGLIVIFFLGLVESAISLTGRLPTPACYIRILWEHPKSCEQRLFPAIPVASDAGPRWFAVADGPERLWLAQDTAARAEPYTDGPIFLQFGGAVDRATSIALAARLTALGWPVEGGEQGGEALATLPDTNEVRYFHAGNRDAAIDLARTIKSEHPGADIVVRDFSGSGLIAPTGLLEIWLAN